MHLNLDELYSGTSFSESLEVGKMTLEPQLPTGKRREEDS